MSTARADLLRAVKILAGRGLLAGTSGNVSVRVADGCLITPTAQPYDTLTPEAMVEICMDGSVIGAGRPSSEWRLHNAVYAAFPDARAVVHTHSTYATALSTLRIEIPAFHYMVAMAGGTTIPCAPYRLFGTADLAEAAVTALGTGRACLLANHGLLVHHDTLDKAVALAAEVEELARQYTIARSLGAPIILDAAEMADVVARFATYR